MAGDFPKPFAGVIRIRPPLAYLLFAVVIIIDPLDLVYDGAVLILVVEISFLRLLRAVAFTRRGLRRGRECWQAELCADIIFTSDRIVARKAVDEEPVRRIGVRGDR
jgi:hypothetical protein